MRTEGGQEDGERSVLSLNHGDRQSFSLLNIKLKNNLFQFPRAISFTIGNARKISFGAFPLFELFLIAAIRENIEIMRKTEMAREGDSERGGGGDGDN